jgi:hypothetical protein
MQSDDKAPARGAINFTDSVLRAMSPPSPGKKDYLKADSKEPGLFIRVGRNGSKTFFFKKLVNGLRARIPIGSWPSVSIAEARKIAHGHTHRLNQGEDIGAKHRAKRRDDVLTVEGAVGAYVEKNPHKASEDHLDKTRRVLSSIFKKVWKRPLDRLPFERFRDCFEDAEDRPGQAHVAGTQMGAVLRWVAAKYKIANPFVGHEDELPPAPDSRQTYLTGEQMRQVYRVAATIDEPASSLIRFLMLVPVRRNEGARMCWGELDGTAWTAPAGK